MGERGGQTFLRVPRPRLEPPAPPNNNNYARAATPRRPYRQSRGQSSLLQRAAVAASGRPRKGRRVQAPPGGAAPAPGEASECAG